MSGWTVKHEPATGEFFVVCPDGHRAAGPYDGYLRAASVAAYMEQLTATGPATQETS